MKIILLACLFSCCYAQLQFGAQPFAATRLGEDGTSSITQFHRNDNNGNYDYGYNEGHNQGGTFRRERGDSFGRKVGTYGYTNNEGLIRIVNYVADENGFRAELKSTEPGVEEFSEPASVIVFKEDTPTLMTYPGPEAASVPDPSGNIPGVPSQQQQQQQLAPAYPSPLQYQASGPVPQSVKAPYPYAGQAQSVERTVQVSVGGPGVGYSYSY